MHTRRPTRPGIETADEATSRCVICGTRFDGEPSRCPACGTTAIEPT